MLIRHLTHHRAKALTDRIIAHLRAIQELPQASNSRKHQIRGHQRGDLIRL
nr:hypothetical protein [Ktedonosporobacter rubrisoli]